MPKHKQAGQTTVLTKRPRKSPKNSCNAGATHRWTFRIIEVVDGLAAHGKDGNAEVKPRVHAEVADLCQRFPIYPNL